MNKLEKKDILIPLHGFIGIILIALFWYLNWNLPGLRSHWGFFPLWLGYCLTVDGLVYFLKGSSLLSRNYKRYIGLFFVSVPGWWLFELFNIRMQNWNYIGKNYFNNTEFFLLASLSFSTVMPAVFSTAELMSVVFRKKNGAENLINPSNKQTIKVLLSGVLILLLIAVFPQYFYFLIWIALYFIVDPINVWLKRPNLLANFYSRDFYPLLVLGAGALVCGFFWEMWNFYSYPKWVYYLPMVNFLHVFEMPVLGYIGYVPFALELFALYSLISGYDLRKQLFK